MLTPQQIIDLLNDVKIDYSLCKSDKTIINVSSENRYINLIIGVRGRESFTQPCINYLKRAINNYNKKVIITLVEQDSTSHYENFAKDNNIDYIFVNNDIVFRGTSYSRAYVYNVGFLLTQRSEWYIMHDIDMLVDENFFVNLDGYLNKGVRWVQPYQKKRVILLSEKSTNVIIENKNTFINLASLDASPAMAGSTGGSIAVRGDIFVEAGGFDPEYFFGYGPEDSFFWSKLEIVNNPNLNMMSRGHFAGGGSFADDPAIDVYHMYHPPLWYSNPHEGFMLEIRRTFWMVSHENKMKIINKKRDVLLKAMETLND